MSSTILTSQRQPDNDTPVQALNRKPAPSHVRACDGCKRQKMKCSSFSDYPEACERCRRRKQPCEFTDQYKRSIKRQQQKESQDGKKHRKPNQQSMFVEDAARHPPEHFQALAQNLIPDQNSNTRPLGSDFSLDIDSVGGDYNAENSIARVLQGVEVSKVEIDETFLSFFKDYSSHLSSFLDPSLSPEQYFIESPLLFWTIVAIGSRHYLPNPTLLSALAGPVSNLAWSSLMQTNDNIYSIVESLVLLATWTFPFKTVFNDMTFTLSGMALSLAMQIGLHLPTQSQDFALRTIGNSVDDHIKRANLWVNCVLCHLRAAAAFGQPAMASADSTLAMLIKEDLLRYIPNESFYQLRLMICIDKANVAVCGGDFPGKGDEQSVVTALCGLETEFSKLELELEGFQDQERLNFHIARLQMRVYYFTQSCEVNSTGNLSKIYHDCIDIVRLFKHLEDSNHLCLSCPTYIWLMLGLSACILLKILGSSDAADRGSTIHSRGRLSYFTAIALLSKISIESEDGPGRLARALTQLWTKRKAADIIDLSGRAGDHQTSRRRPHTRLSMSLFYETIQRYREQHGGQVFVNSLAPRETGIVHGPPPSDSAISPLTSLMLIDDCIAQTENMEPGRILSLDWPPINDDDFTNLGFYSI